ncbi:MAG: T6SS phospholipase effector Tle1-like catalytic domain-containing protein [Marinomonas foliarum]|uniref:T6SS phospholipase effector Tle1-like catalytic domain-containing protein n=1 Tax=Marinomonas foliarum TaxID=491950 RepID=UPI003F9A34D9
MVYRTLTYNQSINYIVLIGFSRGAALARRFAAQISPLIDRSIIIEAVIDTVASIGWPNLDITKRPTTDVVFEHGNTLPDGVHRALHLVALDEQRLAFRPTLINQDGRADEIWLSGVHSDVGGGYRKDGIGDIALQVLINWIEQHTQQNCYHKATHKLIAPPNWQTLLTLEPKHLGKIHYQHRHLHAWRELTLAPRDCCVLENDQPNRALSPNWHQSVTQRIHSNIGYFPIAHCPTPAILWRSKR